ncbi:hypothetical protein SDC9_152919 [bioreactor metagenome]|uniref:Uncharacterized protein n=1 Tax=bioreactor metagenome TaxID=1076179 RepID=A0A645EUF2_9ZZZZ
MLKDDVAFFDAQHLRRVNIFHFPLGEHLRADQTEKARPAENAQHHHNEIHALFNGYARADDCREDQGKGEEGQRIDQLRQP